MQKKVVQHCRGQVSKEYVADGGSVAVTNVAAAAEHMTLVAAQPDEMRAAQQRLVEWFGAKVNAAKADAGDAEENLTVARQSGFKHESFRRAARTAQRRVEFYEKCLAAVEAGYVIVPDFPVDVFAIRVGREWPKWQTSTASDPGWLGQHVQRADVLPAGDGHYVDPLPLVEDRDITPEGAEKKQLQRTVVAYDDPEFPVAIAKPAVLEATRRAMALRLFDELGCLPERRRRGKDPIVVGRIYSPRDRWRDNPLTFLIAWWIDTRTL